VVSVLVLKEKTAMQHWVWVVYTFHKDVVL